MIEEKPPATEITMDALHARIEGQRQWLMATFVLAIVALVLAVLMFVQISRLRADVAAQFDRLERDQRRSLQSLLQTGFNPDPPVGEMQTPAAGRKKNSE